MAPDGTVTNLVSFADTNGANPYAALVQGSDGYFYGTTYAGGSAGKGTVFRMATDGTLTNLVNFTGANGANPYAGLVQGSDGYFYGTTGGTAFKMTPLGGLTTLVNFGSAVNVYAGLVQGSDGYFYGTTYAGGSGGNGTVFKMTSSGSRTTLAIFGYGVDIYAGLVQGNDGYFYGTTYADGSAGSGTVFKISPSGTLTTLVNFANTNGAYPKAALVQSSDGNFYGTTSSGGAGGGGTIYRLMIDPRIVTPPASQTNVVGSTISFAVVAAGTAPLGSQWQFNGASLTDSTQVSGSLGNVLTIANVQATNAGNYAVIITNASGLVTSASAVLTVVLPPQFASVAVLPDNTVQLSLVAVSNVWWGIETSTNLADWVLLTNVVAVNGSVQFIDSNATNWPCRFYRAVWSP